MILIKLGGSVITDKTRYRKFNRRLVSRLCEEIRLSGKNVMIVHGAGSFGHMVSKEFRLQEGYESDDQLRAVVRVSHDMRDLNNRIMKEMVDAGLLTVSIPTGSCFQLDDNEIIGNTDVINAYVKMGIMPVMFGDVVTDRKKGFGICSGDKIMEFLASLFSPEKVIFVSDVDGLYEKDPKGSKDAKLIETVDRNALNDISTEITVDDVTGGVRAKMESMLRMTSGESECILLNGKVKGRLYSALVGEDIICTRASGGDQ